MLGRFAFVRLKAAENALKDGRIDEAFQIVRAPDLRDHRRGQKLLTRLGEAFVERARSHAANGAYGEALLDLDRAEEAGGAKDTITSLRREVRTEADQTQLKNRFRRERLEAARQRIGAGSIRGARDTLADASDGDDQAHALLGRAERRIQEAITIAAEGQQLFKVGRVDAAIERCIRAKGLDGRCEAAVTLEGEIFDAVINRIRTALNDGRLDQAERCLKQLGPLGESSAQRDEAGLMLSLARDAAQAVYRFDLSSARESLRRLALLSPKAGWINEAMENLTSAQEDLASVRGGPLGLAYDAEARVDANSPTLSLNGPPKIDRPKNASPVPAADDGVLPDRLLLMVDGAASFLLLRNSRISIGRMNGEDPADVTLVSDLSQRHAEIARLEDDYFFSSPHDASVNGRSVRDKLLADGDKIRLNRRTSLTFRLPSRRSTSAVLELGDHVRTIGDVRQIVLLQGHASLGSSSSCHMRVPIAAQHLVVYERGESLWVRPQAGGNSHAGASPEEPRPLALGESVEIAGLRLVLDRAAAPGSRLV